MDVCPNSFQGISDRRSVSQFRLPSRLRDLVDAGIRTGVGGENHPFVERYAYTVGHASRPLLNRTPDHGHREDSTDARDPRLQGSAEAAPSPQSPICTPRKASGGTGGLDGVACLGSWRQIAAFILPVMEFSLVRLFLPVALAPQQRSEGGA